MANKVNPKSNSPARSLIQEAEWSQPDWFTKWDVAQPASPESGDGLGKLDDLPDTNSGKSAGGTDPTGGPVLSERVSWEYPDVSRERKENGKPKMTLSNPDPGGGY